MHNVRTFQLTAL